jgi:acyl carrier protein
MAQTADTTWEASGPPPGATRTLAAADAEYLRDALKHCSAATYEAVRRFRETGGAKHLLDALTGIIERHVEPDLRCKLQKPEDGLRLVEDLGVDSLTMMEVVALVEDVFRVSIKGWELQDLRTLGDFRRFITAKVCGAPAATCAQDPPEDWD